MRKIVIHTNGKVEVQLTEYGRKILKMRDDMMRAEIPRRKRHEALRRDAPRWTSFQLWQLMQIFGPHLYNGNPKIPFKDNKIKVAITD